MPHQCHTVLSDSARCATLSRGTAALLSSMLLGVSLLHSVVVAAAQDPTSPHDDPCLTALSSPTESPGFFGRLTSNTKDYLSYQYKLHNAVHPADRDLLMALTSQGVIARADITRGENVLMDAPTTQQLPLFDVNGREFVRVRLGPQLTNAAIITGGRTYHVRLLLGAPRVQQFLTDQGLGNLLTQAIAATTDTTTSADAGPYRQNQNPNPHQNQAAPTPSLKALFERVARDLNNPALVSAVQDSFTESYDFITIKPGRYTMGSSWFTDGRERLKDESEKPVLIAEEFDAQITPVNQIQWVLWKIVDQNTKENIIKNLPRFTDNDSEGDHITFIHKGTAYTLNYDHPAESFSLDEFGVFVEWLNSQPEVVSSNCKYKIFTEEQWEWMARSANPKNVQSRRPVPRRHLERHAFFNANSNDRTHRLNLLEPLANGLRHVFGNVWEHTSSRHGDGGLFDKVIRGGGWSEDPRGLRSAQRARLFPSARSIHVGGRLLRVCW